MDEDMCSISTDYHAKDMHCFVATDRKGGWQIAPIGRAVLDGLDIIGCGYCGKPAAVLDHYWPYSDCHNFCQQHEGMPKEGWAKTRRGKAHYFVGYKSACGRWETEHFVFDLEYDGEKCRECERKAGKRKGRMEGLEVT